jgi:hopanoid biosynthesis associated RND transporter like protein HpnN
MFSARNAWLVLFLGIVLATLSAYYVRWHFAINTDFDQLISKNLPWMEHRIAFQKAFPGEGAGILAVLDAPTPELAQDAAARLSGRLNQHVPHIVSAEQAGNAPFFRRNGLLFLPPPQLTKALAGISRSAPLLRPLAADPSLRGIMGSIGLSLTGVRFHRVSLDALAPQFRAMTQTIEDTLENKPAAFSWQTLLNSGVQPPPKQQIVSVNPKLDFSSLRPGDKAVASVRETAGDLGFAGEGIQLRITGQVPMDDDELNTLREGAVPNAMATIVAILLILWFALHSWRIIVAVFLTIALGLGLTAAAGLLMVKAFNPISVAFFVLFVGIGVDFALQFSVAYRVARYENHDPMRALAVTAGRNGGRLVLAGLATAAGFLSFLPTSYRGVSELGEIASSGMIVALIASLTILPALLWLFNPPPERSPLGYPWLIPLDEFLERRRLPIVAGTVLVILAASPILYWLEFDSNPTHLQNPKAESVWAYLELSKNPNFSSWTADILTPSLGEADAIAMRLEALPEVARVTTLSGFVPQDQDQKLSQIAQTADGLRDILSPPEVSPKPSDEDNINSLNAAAAGLNGAANAHPEAKGASVAQGLARSLIALANASPEKRQKAEQAFVFPLKITLDDIRQSLHPGRIALDTLPPSLVRTWLTPDGRARVSVAPKGGQNEDTVISRFADAVLKVDPNAAGPAVRIAEGAKTIIDAFMKAAIYALISIAILLWLFLRRLSDVAVTLFPLMLAAIFTLEICAATGFKLNFANIIALPVLLGVGVAFKIYYVVAWRQGQTHLLASPLTRAVFYSGLTTAAAFGSLWLSNNPGLSSMGQLLALSLACTMAAAILFQPLLMGPPHKSAGIEPQELTAPWQGAN